MILCRGTMDSHQRLQKIEEESKLQWKHCEGEERCIDGEYACRLAEIDAAFEEAASRIRLNFLAKKEAAKEQFSKDDASRKSSKQLSCTTSQQSSASIAHQQPSLLQSNSMEASVEVHYSNIKSSSEGTQSSAPQSLL